MAIGMREPSSHEKKLLVRYNKFKSLDEIPQLVSSETIRKVRTLYRMKICTGLTFGALFGSIAYGKFSEWYVQGYSGPQMTRPNE